MEHVCFEGVDVRQEAVAVARPTFDIDIAITIEKEVANLQVHHRVEACSESRALCLGEQLKHILRELTTDLDRKVSDLSIMPEIWRDPVVAWSSGPPAASVEPWDWQATRMHASNDPDALALVWQGEEWSRSKLWQVIEETARALQVAGMGPGHVAAVAIHPSPALLIAWQAIYVLGGAVLALDPTWPQERMDNAALQAQARIVLSSPEGATLCITGSASATAPHKRELAYIILTSGSTGAPKLVAVSRSALANELSWFSSAYPIDERDRVLTHSSPGFDVTVWEMLGPLSWGAALVFPSLGRRNDLSHLAKVSQEHAVTVVQAVPSLLEALVGEFYPGDLKLRLLVSGGEEMPEALPEAVLCRLPQAVLLNTYGPSETAIDVVFYPVEGRSRQGKGIPLGRPIAGVSAYVVDDYLRLLPPGAFGQLAIGGAAVGLGYLGDATETARKFVPDRFSGDPGNRMYLTGDRARWNDKGLLEFGGRLDHQVKVRGNRVELQAVEACLRSLSGVHEAAVHLQSPGSIHARLVALIVPSAGQTVTAQDLYEQCGRVLPSYMVPSSFGVVGSLPRLSSGKIDRNALPLESLDTHSPSAGWRTALEAKVARVWMDVLGRKGLTPDLAFFACGGTSLLIPVLHFQLQKALGQTLSVPE
ncbi:MAG: amino acid adenylation domain-containing protein, partial [Tabrizicola sp.]|nr:amino acid adenylation domain-containing protein [Tabrizicola sp.]